MLPGDDRRPDREAARVLEELERIAVARRERSSLVVPVVPAVPVVPVDLTDRVAASLVNAPRHTGRLLGSLLVTRGFLMDDELQHALSIQQQSGERLGEILVRLGLIADTDLAELLAEQLRIDTIRLDRVVIDPAVAGLISTVEARALGALPVRRRRGHIDVAIADPTDERTLDWLARRLAVPLRLYLATRAAIEAAVDGLPDPHARV